MPNYANRYIEPCTFISFLCGQPLECLLHLVVDKIELEVCRIGPRDLNILITNNFHAFKLQLFSEIATIFRLKLNLQLGEVILFVKYGKRKRHNF